MVELWLQLFHPIKILCIIPNCCVCPEGLALLCFIFTKFLISGKPEFSVDSLMTHHCCNRKVVTCFKLLTQATIERARMSICSLSEIEQTQLMLNYMLQHSQGNQGVLYSVGGQIVCETCFRKVYGFRYNRFTAIKAKFDSGVVVAEHGRLGRCDISDASIRVTSWLRAFVDKVGDRMPTSAAVHLPACLTKSDVFFLACDDLSQGGLQCCKISTFYNIWKRNFPNVKIPKVL